MNNSSICGRVFNERPLIAALIHPHASRLGRMVIVFNSKYRKTRIKIVFERFSYHRLQLIEEYEHVNVVVFDHRLVKNI
jgi:hypothetical protein